MTDTSVADTAAAQQPAPKARSPQWNYAPEGPLQVSPLFAWPPRPLAALTWVWNSWFLISERLILVGTAFLAWFYLQPALERCKTFEFGWVAEMYLRNLGLMVLVAGGLHLYLYTFRRQGKQRKYDARPLAKGRVFTLGNQVYDNMFWSCASGVTVWTAYDAVLMWGFANGYLTVLSFANPHMSTAS